MDESSEIHLPDDPAGELRALEAELAEVRKRRVELQRVVAEGPGVEVAIGRVDRDRSALSSPEVEELRRRVQQLHDDLTESWYAVDRQRHMASQLRRRFPSDFRLLDDAFAVEARARREAAEAAAEAGIALLVPGAYTSNPTFAGDDDGSR